MEGDPTNIDLIIELSKAFMEKKMYRDALEFIKKGIAQYEQH